MSQAYKIPKLFTIFSLAFCILLAACQGAEESPKQIGVVNFLPVMDAVLNGFKDEMSELGYVEGEDIIYVYDGPADSVDDLPGVAQELVDAEVDMIISFSTRSTVDTKAAVEGTDIPVVFAPVTDPVGSGIVDNLSPPGGNLTGITNGGSDARRLEWVLILDPTIEVIYIPYNPTDGSAASALAFVEEAADELGVAIITRQVEDVDDIIQAIDELPEEADAIFLLPDIVTVAHIDKFSEAANENKLLLSGVTTSSAEGGALISFGVDFYTMGRQAARLAHQIFEGENPGDLPVEISEFFLHINLITAETIGLDIPDDILDQADLVIR